MTGPRRSDRLRCKLGDLAIVISSGRFPEYLGRIAECTQLVPAFSPVEISGEWGRIGFDGWLLRFPDEDMLLCADKCLLPIRPETDPRDVEHDEEITA